MSQFREHLKYGLSNRFRAYYQKVRLKELGKKVHISQNVSLMRFPKNISIKAEVVIKDGARICACNKSAIIEIGERTTIGYHTFVFASSCIKIGHDCLIAPFVYIVDSDHQIRKTKRINQQPNNSRPIQIGNDVWIASNVTILKGVEIGDGAVIAANSLVNRSVGPYEIWGGSPAVKIGERKD